MTQIRNKYDIQNSIDDEELAEKRRLPNFFDTIDDINPIKGISLSLVLHGAFVVLMLILSALGFVFPKFTPPELANRDIEFKLVQNEEKPPINKNTKIRSDRNSQAGGKHDPTRPVSEPSQKASPAPKAASAPAQKQAQPKQQPKQTQKTSQPKPQPQKVVQQPQKPQLKQQPKPQPAKQPSQTPKQTPQPKVAQAPTPAKPTAVKAPSAIKPNVKPSVAPQGVAKPTAPKIATAPKSPFNVPVAPSGAPIGNAYKPQGSPSAGGASSGAKGGSGSGAPAPKFSSSGGGSGAGSKGASGSSGAGNRYASRGGSGYGGGNPSPGNPNGAPGIDAIKQPNWGPYMRDLEQKIKRNWSPPKGDSSKRVVITFTIGRDGRLLSHKVTKSSGVPLADRAAMSAIELTAPFKPLPPEFKGQSVPIEFTFDYNVLQSVMR